MSRRAQPDNRSSEERKSAHLRRAFDLATTQHPHPNPRVGAVIVDSDGTVVGEGAHVAAGSPHAEILALREAGARARGATAYVSLEPCSHHGRTPPCADALIASGVVAVVIGAVDPDPRVASRGIATLREAGLTVEADVLHDEAVALDPGYFHHRRTGRPLVTLKLAATVDGQAAAKDGTSQWITGRAARRDVHELRSRSDAVMVGAGTLRNDDPLLDVRLDRFDGPQPRPVVIAGFDPLPPEAKIYARNPLVYRTAAAHDVPVGVEAVSVGGASGVDLTAVVKDLGSRGVIDLLVEGGPTLATSFLDDGLVDRLVIYLGAKLAGGVGRPMLPGVWETLADARRLKFLDVVLADGDLRIVAEIVEEV